MSALTVTPLNKPAGPEETSALPRRNPVRTDAAAAAHVGRARRADGEGLGFADLVDTLNPLQQLPLIGDIYRSVTGDEISQQARYAGSALYGLALGGPVGMSAFMGMAMVGDAVSDHLASEDVQVATSGGSDAVKGEPAAGAPTDLFRWLRPEAVDARFPLAAGEGEPADGSDLPRAAPAGVSGLAADPDNHLPLSVLETLRQRHMGLLGDEQA